MDFEIEPKAGIGGLSLGSSKEAVRQFFKAEPRPFQRTPTDNPADYWVDDGVFAYYDGEGNLEALEFSSPASAKLNGKSLTNMSMEQATDLLQSLDENLSVEEGGASVHSQRLGVAIWCSTPGEGDANVGSVLICGNGYFD